MPFLSSLGLCSMGSGSQEATGDAGGDRALPGRCAPQDLAAVRADVEDPPEATRDIHLPKAVDEHLGGSSPSSAKLGPRRTLQTLGADPDRGADRDAIAKPGAALDAKSKLIEVESAELQEDRGFSLAVQQAVSGAALATVQVRPAETVAQVVEKVLREIRQVGVVALQLVLGDRVLDPSLTVEEAGLDASCAEVCGVLRPLRCLTASLDGTARIRLLQSGVQLMVELGARVWSSAIAPGGSTLLMVSTNGEGSLWCAETGVHLVTLRERILNCAFSPDGAQFAGAADDFNARVWCAETGRCLQALTGHTDDIKATTFSPDGKLVATASSDESALIFQAASGRRVRTLAGHRDVVMSVAFSPDGRYVATASMDSTARLWRTTVGECVRTLSGHTKAVDAVQFSPDGQRVLTTSFDGTARVWRVCDGECVLTLAGDNSVVKSAAFSPDGTGIIVAAGSERIRLFDSTTGDCRVEMVGHEDWVRMATFSPDGMLVASASYDGTSRIWSALTGECLQVLGGHAGAVISAELIAS